MTLSKLNKDLNYHQKLPDRPNANDGLTPSEVKERFDQGVNDIKEFINSEHIPELEDVIEGLEESISGKASESFLINHINNKANPHTVTKSQVGLGNVDNVKQASKDEFDLHTFNKGNPHGVTKNQVGLGSVENYGVAFKSQAEAGTVNTAYMTPLTTKQAIEYMAQNAFSKVNNIPATSKTDTLNIEGGIGIEVTNNPTTKKVTINATGEALPGKHGSTHNNDGSDPIPELVSHMADTTTGLGKKANKVQEGWIDATLQNGWVGNPRYFKDDFGFVHLKGQINSGTATKDTLLLTLPSGYRPLGITTLSALSYTATNSKNQGLSINSTGELRISYTDSFLYISLDGIYFKTS